ncbi:MAG: hypothetical protein AB1345_01130 [Chloroflexota bacterium]
MNEVIPDPEQRTYAERNITFESPGMEWTAPAIRPGGAPAEQVLSELKALIFALWE